jgi:hypothetical protein
LNKSWYSYCQRVRLHLHNLSKIHSNEHAFAALKADGSIKAWGDPFTGGESAPTDKGYTKIYSNKFAFAGLNKL